LQVEQDAFWNQLIRINNISLLLKLFRGFDSFDRIYTGRSPEIKEVLIIDWEVLKHVEASV
jgi:hypothetical protein